MDNNKQFLFINAGSLTLETEKSPISVCNNKSSMVQKQGHAHRNTLLDQLKQYKIVDRHKCTSIGTFI